MRKNLISTIKSKGVATDLSSCFSVFLFSQMIGLDISGLVGNLYGAPSELTNQKGLSASYVAIKKFNKSWEGMNSSALQNSKYKAVDTTCFTVISAKTFHRK